MCKCDLLCENKQFLHCNAEGRSNLQVAKAAHTYNDVHTCTRTVHAVDFYSQKLNHLYIKTSAIITI